MVLTVNTISINKTDVHLVMYILVSSAKPVHSTQHAHLSTAPSMLASSDAHRVTFDQDPHTMLVQQLHDVRAYAEDLLHAFCCFSELNRAQQGLELLQAPNCNAAEVLAEARWCVSECSAARAGSRAKPGTECAQAHGRCARSQVTPLTPKMTTRLPPQGTQAHGRSVIIRCHGR